MLTSLSIASNFIEKYPYVFWDFDGVIKDSLEVKSDAFEQLFKEYNDNFAKRVRAHHEANCGMSRYDKIPIYLKWSGQSISETLLDEYSENFSMLVKQKVIGSAWVEGVVEYMKMNYKQQSFFLLTATPQEEIEEILEALSIDNFFIEVFGSPAKKNDVLRMLLKKYQISCKDAIFVGDGAVDYNAASANNVPFVLRRTNLNLGLQKELDCPMIDNFLL